MEKKAAKKTALKKKVAGSKEIEIKSPWTEVASDVTEPPVVTGGLTSSARPVKAKKTTSAPRASVAKSDKTKKPKSESTSKAAGSAPKVRKPVKAKKTAKLAETTLDVTTELAAAEPRVALSPVFKALAEPKLPALQRENRARLMMQTPTKLYFYWSVRQNPYQLLKHAFGDDTGNYTLVLKLTELNSGIEHMQPAEPEGNWWFDVEPNGKYEAEIGFYATNRPYFRIIYSNTIETPRRSPSPRVATDMDWRVSASKFAEVLDVAGFSQDAFDVAMAGDDHEAAEHVTHTAFAQFIGNRSSDLRGIAAEDIRYSLMALASGVRLADLRSRIGSTLFAILQANAANIAAGNAMSVLTEYFDVDETDFTEHQYGSAVYGASLVNFPRTLKTRRTMPKYSPLSSYALRER